MESDWEQVIEVTNLVIKSPNNEITDEMLSRVLEVSGDYQVCLSSYLISTQF